MAALLLLSSAFYLDGMDEVWVDFSPYFFWDFSPCVRACGGGGPTGQAEES